MPTSHAPLDRSAFSLSSCPKIRSRRKSRWSAHAAICAGVAAILGAMPLICWKRLKLGHYPLGCWWSTIPKKKVRILLDVLGQRLAVPHDGIGQEHLGCRHHLRLYKCHLSLHPVLDDAPGHAHGLVAPL